MKELGVGQTKRWVWVCVLVKKFCDWLSFIFHSVVRLNLDDNKSNPNLNLISVHTLPLNLNLHSKRLMKLCGKVRTGQNVLAFLVKNISLHNATLTRMCVDCKTGTLTLFYRQKKIKTWFWISGIFWEEKNKMFTDLHYCKFFLRQILFFNYCLTFSFWPILS